MLREKVTLAYVKEKERNSIDSIDPNVRVVRRHWCILQDVYRIRSSLVHRHHDKAEYSNKSRCTSKRRRANAGPMLAPGHRQRANIRPTLGFNSVSDPVILYLYTNKNKQPNLTTLKYFENNRETKGVFSIWNHHKYLALSASFEYPMWTLWVSAIYIFNSFSARKIDWTKVYDTIIRSACFSSISPSILNRFSWNFAQDIFRLCHIIGKKFAKFYWIFQKLDHLTCNKIPELV